MSPVTQMALLILGALLIITMADARPQQSSEAEVEESNMAPNMARLKRRVKAQRCGFQLEACDPYDNSCCTGMKCANLFGGYCLSGIEKCMCLPKNYGV